MQLLSKKLVLVSAAIVTITAASLAQASNFSGLYKVDEANCNLYGGPSIAHGGSSNVQLEYQFNLNQRALDIREIFAGKDVGSAGSYVLGVHHYSGQMGGALITDNSVKSGNGSLVFTSLEQVDNNEKTLLSRTDIALSAEGAVVTVTEQNGSSTRCKLVSIQ